MSWVTCTCGKRGHASEDAAKVACADMRNRFRIYRCPRSQLFHVTDSDRSQRQGKSRRVKAKHRQQRRTKRRKTRQALSRWCA